MICCSISMVRRNCIWSFFRAVISRIAAVTRMPSVLSSGLSMISIGNALPFLRRADQLDPGADLLRQRVLRGAQRIGDQPLRETLRNDVLDRLPDQFVAAITELLFRLLVQQHDFAALVHHHHDVGRRLEQTPIAALHLRKLLLGRLAHADVADRGGDQDSLRALQRAEHDLDRKAAAVLAPAGEFDTGADLLRQRLRGASGFVGRSAARRSPSELCSSPAGRPVRRGGSRTAFPPARSAGRCHRFGRPRPLHPAPLRAGRDTALPIPCSR